MTKDMAGRQLEEIARCRASLSPSAILSVGLPVRSFCRHQQKEGTLPRGSFCPAHHAGGWRESTAFSPSGSSPVRLPASATRIIQKMPSSKVSTHRTAPARPDRPAACMHRAGAWRARRRLRTSAFITVVHTERQEAEERRQEAERGGGVKGRGC